ncbi:Hint domain-containing protein [Paracoccus salsus]|uniref:Hint domain-containing protein n=1 Tax=Paracoccus salsus TaxID=2911061 RepID=UPI001F49076E|nr:Hint domain-containing protein [Paracoccus salsus]MCF3972218.1 Hint domain-containing protein [Paracoccus salsus]
MDYQITMLTVSQAIPRGTGATTKFAPWSNSYNPITFQDPVLTSISITDDDENFNSGYYTPNETQQTLTNATTFGYGAEAQTLPAGTKLENWFGSTLVDINDPSNTFVVMFPYGFSTGTTPPTYGSYQSVLIFPQPKVVNGETVYPTFDLSASYRFKEIENVTKSSEGQAYPPQSTVPCFVSGTMIETMFGPRAIESLTVGDLIRTRDNGMRWLSWIGSTYLSPAQLDLQPNLRPIRICAHALAPGVPARNLIVSPQHRVLVRSTIAQRMFDENEILVAAKHLVGLPGIEAISPQQGVTYWHMLFDGHEIVLSNGAWSESLFTGTQAMEAVGPQARREILTLFPQLADPGFRPVGARRLLNGREGRRLAERHARNKRQLVEPG